MKNKALTSLAILLCTITSCIENISIDSRKEMPVVVNCILKMDTVQTMQLYQMRVLSEKKSTPIEDAEVYLQKNGETVAEFHKEEGIKWETRFQPEYGTKYSLLIKIPGKEDITATTIFPEDLRLIQCNRFACLLADTGIIGIPLRGYGMHTAEVRKGRYYDEWQGTKKGDGSPFKAYMTVSESPCKIWIYSHTDTTSVSPGRRSLNITSEDQYRFSGSDKPFSKYIATNHPGADRFNITLGRLADMRYWNRPDIGGRSNYSQWSVYLCPDIPLFDGFVRIDHPANFRNGLSQEDLKNSYYYSDRSFFIGGDYSDDHNAFAEHNPIKFTYNIFPNRSFLNEVHFVSDEYDAYLRALHIKIHDKDDFILSSYDYENLPSNINGGVGIFGADNTTWDMEETRNRLTRKDFLIWEELCPNAPEETK